MKILDCGSEMLHGRHEWRNLPREEFRVCLGVVADQTSPLWDDDDSLFPGVFRAPPNPANNG